MFAADPDRVLGFVIQNGNAYEGLPEGWNDIRAYWADPSPANAERLRAFLTLEGTIWQFTAGTRDRTRRSAERSVGNECVSTGRYRWCPDQSKKKKEKQTS